MKKHELVIDGSAIGEVTVLPGGPSYFLIGPYHTEVSQNSDLETRLKNYVAFILEQGGDDGPIDVAFIFDNTHRVEGHVVGRVSSSPVKGHDPVNHPKHYTSHPSGVECIDITRHMGFNLGNTMKYIWRDGLKDTEAPLQDLKKALWYLTDEIKMREKALES